MAQRPILNRDHDNLSYHKSSIKTEDMFRFTPNKPIGVPKGRRLFILIKEALS